MAWVTFVAECRATKPGEALFVVGSHEALGSWTAAHALPMTTNASTFPEWSSAAVMLPKGEAVEYKYVILRDTDMSVVKWESFQGNRSVQVPAGGTMSVKSLWDNPNSTSKITAPPSVVPEPREPGVSPNSRDWAAAGVVEESGTLKKSMSGVAVFGMEMEAILEEMAEREPMRRNFSQSLMCLPGGDEDSEAEEPEVQGPDVQVVQAAMEDESGELPMEPQHTAQRGVSLQHIMSFSALTEMASVEAKEQARKKTNAQSQYEPYNRDVPVVIVTSEVAPYSKSGGLGLVAGSYSYEFPRNGHRTMLVSPKYQHYDGLTFVGETRVRVDGREECVKYWHKFMSVHEGKGCDFIFVDHPSIERKGGLYNGDDGREYNDNLFRFTLCAAAAMEAPLLLTIDGSKYGDKVIFLANDWQAGLVPLWLCHKYRRNGCYTNSRCIYVVHNLGYQGQYPNVNACNFFGLEGPAAADVTLGKCINLMKGALICADRVLTVSPNYAREIQTREGGFGLDDLVRAKAQGQRLSGILNGIDDCWNPESDEKIKRNFSVDDFVEAKQFNKAHLQKLVGLKEDPDVVLLGFVGRLTWQKGVDVLAEVISWLMHDTGNGVTGRVQLIMMGNGEEKYASALRSAESSFRGRVCGYVGFDPNVEHQMMAGCDLFVMPSRYEPCGLPQMYAQQYGTLPVVSATGGLVDSVRDISVGADTATGFHIAYMSADKMKDVLYRAMELFLKKPDDFRRMQRTAMQTDFFWPRAMDQYEQNIDYTLYDPPLQR